jgi:hypothetical protein
MALVYAAGLVFAVLAAFLLLRLEAVRATLRRATARRMRLKADPMTIAGLPGRAARPPWRIGMPIAYALLVSGAALMWHLDNCSTRRSWRRT